MEYKRTADDIAQWDKFHEEGSYDFFMDNTESFRNEMEKNIDFFVKAINKNNENISILNGLYDNKNIPNDIKVKIEEAVSSFEDSIKIYSFYGNVCLMLMDINEYNCQMNISNSEYEWRAFARHIYTIIYEQHKSISPQLNRYVQLTRDLVGNSNSDYVEMSKVKDEFAAFLEQYKEYAKSVRVNADAHYNMDFRKRVEIIENLSYRDINGIVIDYYEKAGTLLKSQMPILHIMENKLTEHFHYISNLMNQYLDQVKNARKN